MCTICLGNQKLNLAFPVVSGPGNWDISILHKFKINETSICLDSTLFFEKKNLNS